MATLLHIQFDLRQAAAELDKLTRATRPGPRKEALAGLAAAVRASESELDFPEDVVYADDLHAAEFEAQELGKENERLRAVIETCLGCRYHDPSDPLGCPQAGRSFCTQWTSRALAS